MGIDGERVIKPVRSKIIQAQKETPCACYYTPSKDKSKPVIYATLNITPTTKAHRAVVAVMKKRRSEGDATPTTNNFRLKQVGDQMEEAQSAIPKHAMTNSIQEANLCLSVFLQ